MSPSLPLSLSLGQPFDAWICDCHDDTHSSQKHDAYVPSIALRIDGFIDQTMSRGWYNCYLNEANHTHTHTHTESVSRAAHSPILSCAHLCAAQLGNRPVAAVVPSRLRRSFAIKPHELRHINTHTQYSQCYTLWPGGVLYVCMSSNVRTAYFYVLRTTIKCKCAAVGRRRLFAAATRHRWRRRNTTMWYGT